jgi:8-oxo-dGTP pyrophosphatase MutT (NUDIX family)
MPRDVAQALALVEAFHPQGDGLAEKSRELILQLLQHSRAPFSRDQFKPGHITCTALIFSPDRRRVLLMLHHRHRRWLLPGGHVEEEDETLAAAAAREAVEETGIELAGPESPALAGMDVHGIPPKKNDPYHLHHDLIFALHARSEAFTRTEEAPEIAWCAPEEFARYHVPSSIVRSAARAGSR